MGCVAKNPIQKLPRAISEAVISRGRNPRRGDAPSRAEDGARFLEELKKQASVLFGGILPMGPAAVVKFLSVQTELVKVTRPDGGSAPVLDLLLRLSEGVGLNSGYARVLRGAAVAFMQHGYERVRIEDILEAGDVSPRTFYQFFRNKHEVLSAFADLFLTVLGEMCRRELSREGPPEERLRRFVQMLIGGMAIVERMAQILVSEAIRPGTELEPQYDRFRTEMMSLLEPVFREITGAEPDTVLIRVRLIASMGALVELGLTSKSTPEDLQRAELVVYEILRGP